RIAQIVQFLQFQMHTVQRAQLGATVRQASPDLARRFVVEAAYHADFVSFGPNHPVCQTPYDHDSDQRTEQGQDNPSLETSEERLAPVEQTSLRWLDLARHGTRVERAVESRHLAGCRAFFAWLTISRFWSVPIGTVLAASWCALEARLLYLLSEEGKVVVVRVEAAVVRRDQAVAIRQPCCDSEPRHASRC